MQKSQKNARIKKILYFVLIARGKLNKCLEITSIKNLTLENIINNIYFAIIYIAIIYIIALKI